MIAGKAGTSRSRLLVLGFWRATRVDEPMGKWLRGGTSRPVTSEPAGALLCAVVGGGQVVSW